MNPSPGVERTPKRMRLTRNLVALALGIFIAGTVAYAQHKSATSPAIGTLYASDTSLQPDGRTRVIGYTREVGNGGVTYFALGHCHNPAIRAARAPNPTDNTPPTFHGSWETDAFITLLRNAIAWGVAA